jgi:transposase
MTEVTTIGVDLAKTVFQIHGVDASGAIVIRKQLRRRQVLPFFRKQPPCLVGMEACATAHHWAREIAALGHEVKLMPPHYVKPYVKRNKNDAADAEAICEAVTRPTMRFVAVKSAEQQSVLMLHRTRELLVRQRTMLVNAIRAHMAEFGMVARTGLPQVKELLTVIADKEDERIPPLARTCLEGLARQLLSRTDHGERVGIFDHRSARLSVRPRDGRLDRACAKTELNRWQGAHGSDLQAGRSIPALAAGRRRHDSHPPR